MGKKKQIEYFENLLSKYGADHRALDWNSPESQKLRMDILYEMFVYGKKTVNVSVLDVGCGLGDLFDFFKSKKSKICYTGYDISSKIIEAAKKKYPEAHFEVRDILEDENIPKFDYVFCSGVFNIRTMDIKSHKAHVRSMLERIYDLAKCGVAANFLSEGRLPPADPMGLNVGRYYFFNPEDIVKYIRHMTNQYIIRHDYHQSDFTVYLFK